MRNNLIKQTNSHFRFVTKELSPYWKRLLLAFICTLILGLLSAVVACLIGPCIQVISSNHNKHYLLSDLIGKNFSFLISPFIQTTHFKAAELVSILPILLSLVGAAKCVFSIAQAYIWENTCEQIAKKLRTTLINKYLAIPKASRRKEAISSIENQLSSIITTDIKLTKEYLSHFYGGFPRELTQIIFMIITLFLLSSQLTFIFIFCLLPTIFILKKFGKKLRIRSTEVLSEMSTLSEWLQQRLLGMETVKLYKTENIEIKKMERLTSRLYHKLLKSEKIKARSGPTLEVLAIIAMVIILFMAFKAIQHETLTGSMATSFFATVALLSQSANKMGRYFNQNKEADASIERIYQAFFAIESEQNSLTNTTLFQKKNNGQILKCENLSVGFSEKKNSTLFNF